MLKILNSFGERSGSVKHYENALRTCNNDLYGVTGLNHRQYLGISRAWMPLDLDYHYRNKNPKLINFYEYIYKLCDSYDVFIVDHENVYHPEFIKKLSKKIYTVLYTSDDPEASYVCSQPYVWAFDHVFCYAIFYDDKCLMVDKLKEWGSKRANHRPFGYQPHKCDNEVNENNLLSLPRDIDLIYIGGAYNKVENLLLLKKTFGRRFKIYGNWGGVKGAFSRIKRFKYFEYIKPLDENDFINVYKKSKIGINMHMSYGPSNLRMWELPINGVLQITDNPEGTSKLFNINKEIVCYENNNMEEAIEKIDYYLTHDAERNDIAINAFKMVRENYQFNKCFWRSMRNIEEGMIEKSLGITNM